MQHILVLGPSGAGKSTLARELERRGRYRISAGDVIRGLAPSGGTASRSELAAFGKQYLALQGENEFAHRILSLVPPARAVVIEGVRPPGVVSLLKQHLPGLLIVFLDVPAELRRTRVRARDGLDEMQWESYRRGPMELQVEQLREMADLRVSGELAPEEIASTLPA